MGGLVNEADPSHPTHGNGIVAFGEPPHVPLIASAVAEDGARRSPVQGRDWGVRFVNDEMGPRAGNHLNISAKGTLHNPQGYQFWGLGSRGNFARYPGVMESGVMPACAQRLPPSAPAQRRRMQTEPCHSGERGFGLCSVLRLPPTARASARLRCVSVA